MRTSLVGVLLLTCSLFFSPIKAATPDGKTLYDAKCKTCHGIDGKGVPKMDKILKVDAALLNLTTTKNRERTDLEIIKVTREGQGKMKAIPKDKLNDEDLKVIVAYVRNLQKAKK